MSKLIRRPTELSPEDVQFARRFLAIVPSRCYSPERASKITPRSGQHGYGAAQQSASPGVTAPLNYETLQKRPTIFDGPRQLSYEELQNQIVAANQGTPIELGQYKHPYYMSPVQLDPDFNFSLPELFPVEWTNVPEGNENFALT